MINTLHKKSDALGAISSTLCMIHCMATPFVLVSIPAATGYGLWLWLDFFFLAISSIAVFQTLQTSNISWIKIGLVISLCFLFFFVFNERFEGIEFPFDMVYIPAFSLVILHLLNRRLMSRT